MSVESAFVPVLDNEEGLGYNTLNMTKGRTGSKFMKRSIGR